MSIYDVFYTYLECMLKLYPVYSESTLDVNADIKGHITISSLLLQMILVVLNKDCRIFYKKIKKAM